MVTMLSRASIARRAHGPTSRVWQPWRPVDRCDQRLGLPVKEELDDLGARAVRSDDSHSVIVNEVLTPERPCRAPCVQDNRLRIAFGPVPDDAPTESGGTTPCSFFSRRDGVNVTPTRNGHGPREGDLVTNCSVPTRRRVCVRKVPH